MEKFTREPFAPDPDALRPGTARRRALDAALAEIESGPRGAEHRVAPAVLADARARAPAGRRRAEARRRHGAVRPPGRRAVGHADRADRRGRAPERQRRRGAPGRVEEVDEEDDEDEPEDEDDDDDDEDDEDEDEEAERRGVGRAGSRPNGAGRVEDEQLPEQPEDPGAARRFWFEHATGAGKTVAALGFVEGSRTGGTLILTHRRNLVEQFLGELKDRGYSNRICPAAAARPGPRRRPRDRRDLPVVRAQRRQHLGRVHDRDLRRGPHRAGREDERLDPQLARPGLHRHDGDRRADRAARHRPLPDPDEPLRPRAGRPPRRDRAAALRADPAGPRRAHARQGPAAKGRGGPGLRPGGAGRAARPGPVQRRRRRPLPRALQAPARHRLQRRA